MCVCGYAILDICWIYILYLSGGREKKESRSHFPVGHQQTYGISISLMIQQVCSCALVSVSVCVWERKRKPSRDERFSRQTQVSGWTCWGGTLFTPKRAQWASTAPHSAVQQLSWTDLWSYSVMCFDIGAKSRKWHITDKASQISLFRFQAARL